MRHVLNLHGLFEDGPVPFPLVLENDAAVSEAGERLREQHQFVPEFQAALIEAMLASPRITFLLFSLDTVRMLWPSEAGWQMVRRFALSMQPFSQETDWGVPLTKVVSIAETLQPLRAFATETSALALERA